MQVEPSNKNDIGLLRASLVRERGISSATVRMYKADVEQLWLKVCELHSRLNKQFKSMQEIAISGKFSNDISYVHIVIIYCSLLIVGKNSLRGVAVCGETTLIVCNSPQSFDWDDFGIKIQIFEDSLPPGVTQCKVMIKASLAGHYKFDDGTYLVSAVYWFHCEPSCKFLRPLSVEMQHCASRANVPQLSFASAVYTERELPYIFKPVHYSNFTNRSSYGIVDVNDFSGYAITQSGSDEQRYIANVLYKKIENCNNSFYLYFVVVRNLQAYLTAVSYCMAQLYFLIAIPSCALTGLL